MKDENGDNLSKKDEKETIISKVQAIIKQYGGMRLTLRQIFYRLVATQVIKNTEPSYKKLGRILVEARKAKKIRYTDIEDRTRAVHGGAKMDKSAVDHFRNGLGYLKNLDTYYSMPRWWAQKKRVVVFVEKEALASVFENVTNEREVDLVVCRGYPSLTLMYDVAEHIKMTDSGEESIHFLYFGDYDPSGADIERHVSEELSTTFGMVFEMGRVAITREQIEELHIPPAPAKATDPRTKDFEEREGVAWQVELDAIEPEALQQLIREAIDEHFDDTLSSDRKDELEERKRQIRGWVQGALNPEFVAPRRT